jgi:hypothetical protein
MTTDALHVTNGDITAGLLRRAGAGFLAGVDGIDAAEVRQRFEARDRALAAGRDARYLLWFEADLYCQLQLTQILAALGALGVAPDRITLVCIGEYPGIAHFGGLGELEPEQLGGLLDTAATPLTAEAHDLGAAAWAALRAPDPGGLGQISASRSPQLRFLGEAFDRLAREYPSTRDGLSLTERRILAATPEAGTPAGTVFARLGEREARPYLGDLFFFRIVARLAGAPVPLLELDPPGGRVDAGTRLRRTEAGDRVLRGEADHVALNGIDRWVGGVHLQGPDAPWRWDEGTESITGPAGQ